MSMKAVGLFVSLVLLIPLAVADPAAAVTRAAETDAVTGASATPTPSATPSDAPAEEPAPTPTPTVDPAPTPEPIQPVPDQAPQETQEIQEVQALAVPVPSPSRIATSTDAYISAINATQAAFPGGADQVILTTAAYPVFAAASAGMAAELGAAMLYVQPAGIPGAVLTELRRLAPSTITIVGGPTFVTEAVANIARTVTPDVRRFGGGSVYESARLMFEAGTAAADTAYLAGAGTILDLPLAGTLAAKAGKRLLAVDGNAAPTAATIAALRAAGTTSVVLVRGSAMSAGYESGLRAAGFTVTSFANADQFNLATVVARTSGVGRTTSYLVNPWRPWDVAVAAGLAAVTAQPLYYSFYECVHDVVATDLTGSRARVTFVGDTNSLSAAVASNVKCSAEKARRQNALSSAIQSTMSSYQGTFSVTVRQLGGLNEIVSVGGGIRREPASMMKIFAAWAVLERVEQGRVSLNSTLASGVSLGTCIQVMIHVSDNYCHTDIAHWIGIPELNRMIRDAGFTNTVYGSVPRGTSVLYAGNRTTTNDLAWMMERLANRSILVKPYADLLINHMRSQIWKSRIASGIPPGVPQASKPGALWIASGLLQGDTAIVNGSRHSYIVSIIGDNGPPQAALRAISRTVYTHFNGSFGAAASYPVQQMVTKTPSILRSSPGGAVVATIPSGVLIEVIDAQRTWYQVRWNGRVVWVLVSGLRNR